MRYLLPFLILIAAGCGGGDMAPNVKLERLGERGKALDLEAFRGKIVVLDFWATWCGPCRESMPHIGKLAEKYEGKGVEVIALSDESRATVEKFASEVDPSVPLYLDPTGGDAAKAFGVNAIPCTLVIDKAGRIAFRGHPMETDKIEAAIEKGL